MFLSDAPNGASFKVLKVLMGKEVGKRLADMGFTEGAEGAVVRSGFFRGPLQVRIRGYDILIRRCEAAGIAVEPVGDWTAAEDASRLFGLSHHRRRFGPGHIDPVTVKGGAGAPTGPGHSAPAGSIAPTGPGHSAPAGSIAPTGPGHKGPHGGPSGLVRPGQHRGSGKRIGGKFFEEGCE